MYKIYKLTSPNGKVYIGQTSKDCLYKRWNYGNGYSKNKALYNDILMYGWNNFKHEVIDIAETYAEAAQKERDYILMFESNNPDKGYNKHVNESSQPKLHTYIRCVENGELFESMAAAGEKYGVTREAIRYAIKNGKCSVNRHWEKVQMTREDYAAIKLSPAELF